LNSPKVAARPCHDKPRARRSGDMLTRFDMHTGTAKVLEALEI
jgi:hypothetical protein